MISLIRDFFKFSLSEIKRYGLRYWFHWHVSFIPGRIPYAWKKMKYLVKHEGWTDKRARRQAFFYIFGKGSI